MRQQEGKSGGRKEENGHPGAVKARVTWISGWGINPESLRPTTAHFLPGADHTYLPPLSGAAEAAAQSDWVVGWSLGAWCVLLAAARGIAFRGRVVLLAPFVAFCSEYNLGGRCSRTQIKWLRRWLQREPVKALDDFYERAGLEQHCEKMPYATEDLLRGLEWLEADAPPELRRLAAQGLPENWSACVGNADPLLDAQAVARSLKGCQILSGVGHDFSGLMTAQRNQPPMGGCSSEHRIG